MRVGGIILQRRMKGPLGGGEIPARQRFSALGIRVEGCQHVSADDVRPQALGIDPAEQNGIGELAKLRLELLSILVNAHGVIADRLAPAPQVVECRGDLNGVAHRGHIAPHEHACTHIAGEPPRFVERHRLITVPHPRVVYPQRIGQAHIRPAPERLREEQLALIAVDQGWCRAAAVAERDHDVQRRVQLCCGNPGKHDHAHRSQTNQRDCRGGRPASRRPPEPTPGRRRILRTQCVRKLARRRKSLARHLGERHVDRILDLERNLPALLRDRPPLPARRSAGEGRVADEHFVQHAAQAVDVAPAVDFLPAGLLGTHVVDRTHDDACTRHM